MSRASLISRLHCAGGGYERLEAWQQQLGMALANNPYEFIEIGYELW